MGIRAATLALLLLAAPATAQEALMLAPGHALRLHPATPDHPGAFAYRLDLAEGDWLVVTAPAAIVDGSATEPPIVLTGPQGQQLREFGRLVVRIAATGPWRLALAQAHAVEVARYPAGHPLVDPGLAPAALRLDPGPFGPVAVTVEPHEPRYDDVPPPSGTPARLAITLGDLTIHLYRRAALRQGGLWAHDPTALVARLLEGDGPVESGLHLPYYPIGNAYMAYAAQAGRVRGACFTWLRYVARHAQEAEIPFPSLTYTALGLSPDGVWFAVASAEIAAPRVPAGPGYEAALTATLAGDSARLAPLDAVAASLCPG